MTTLLDPSITPPIRIEPAYEDRGHVWSLVERHQPYRLMAGLAGYGEIGKMTVAMPWFRENWALGGRPLVDGIEGILHNPHFIDGAKEMFGASVIRPETLLVNVMGPMPVGAPHVDTPTFRGLDRAVIPVWLLLVMGGSGLFSRWQMHVAGAVTWFYEGGDGEFEYWPKRGGASIAERGPFGNAAVITDSDRMFHRVGAIGTESDHLAPGAFTADARLRFISDGAAEIVEGDRTMVRLRNDQVRTSILWKANVFVDEQAAAVFDEHTDDLTVGRVVDIFAADLRHRDVSFDLPQEPLTDSTWAQLLIQHYRLPTLN